MTHDGRTKPSTRVAKLGVRTISRRDREILHHAFWLGPAMPDHMAFELGGGKRMIDWELLARDLDVVSETGEVCGSDKACLALEQILGTDEIRDAVAVGPLSVLNTAKHPHDFENDMIENELGFEDAPDAFLLALSRSRQCDLEMCTALAADLAKAYGGIVCGVHPQ